MFGSDVWSYIERGSCCRFSRTCHLSSTKHMYNSIYLWLCKGLYDTCKTDSVSRWGTCIRSLMGLMMSWNSDWIHAQLWSLISYSFTLFGEHLPIVTPNRWCRPVLNPALIGSSTAPALSRKKALAYSTNAQHRFSAQPQFSSSFRTTQMTRFLSVKPVSLTAGFLTPEPHYWLSIPSQLAAIGGSPMRL